jgi:hypothetical protein
MGGLNLCPAREGTHEDVLDAYMKEEAEGEKA